jgi:alpha-beta hydrolase superfamily lysophospholipase
VGVVDRCFVVGTCLLQHVVEHSRASRGRSRAPPGRVNGKSFGGVVVTPLLARLAARLLSLLAPLVLLAELVGLAALRRRVVRALALLVVEDRPHCLFARGKAGGDVEQLV